MTQYQKSLKQDSFFDDDTLVVKREDEKWINPLFSNHFDIVFSGLFVSCDLDQIAFSYLGGAGASFKPFSSLYVNVLLGPSFFTTFGFHNGTFGLGLGGSVSLSYVFSNPGFMLKAGVQSSYTLLFDSRNTMMMGGFPGIGFKL